MPDTPDITIIGSGIIGLLTAREFSLAGASVAIIEKNSLGQESSWAGGGILLPLYPWRQDRAITALVMHSLEAYPKLSATLFDDSGINPEWTDCGLLISKNPDFESAIHWCRSNHIPFEKPDVSQFACFNAETLNPLWLPTIAQARNPRLLKALIKDLQTRGVQFIKNCALQQINCRQNRVASINTSSGTFTVNHLLLATGAWTGNLWENLSLAVSGLPPDIHPVKGQMLLFATEPQLLTHMILHDDLYLIPRRDGKILVGSSVEHCGFDKRTSSATKHHLVDFALNLFPSLKNYPLINHWAGLRPGTTHGVPYIGLHPELENLSINAGHFRNGLAMGPASAKLLVDLVLDRPVSIDAKPYSLETLH